VGFAAAKQPIRLKKTFPSLSSKIPSSAADKQLESKKPEYTGRVLNLAGAIPLAEAARAMIWF